MKKLLAASILAMFASHVTAGYLTFEVDYYASPSQSVYKPENGGLAKKSENWTIALYRDVAGDGIDLFASNNDDLLLGTTKGYNGGSAVAGAWSGDGVFSGDVNACPDGAKLFFRVYDAADFVNNSSIGSATRYVNLGEYAGVSGIFNNGVWNEVFPPSGNDAVKLLGSKADGTDWKPIPEPASLALFGLGLATLAARRLAKK